MKIPQTAVACALALVLAACGSTREASGDVTPYPLDTCVVMDAELGSMGDPIVRVYHGREIKFCCAPCVTEFESDPEFYLAKVDAAVAAQKND